jgi:hypothetical protein
MFDITVLRDVNYEYWIASKVMYGTSNACKSKNRKNVDCRCLIQLFDITVSRDVIYEYGRASKVMYGTSNACNFWRLSKSAMRGWRRGSFFGGALRGFKSM